MNPTVEIIMERLAWIALAGGLASFPMLFLVGWRGWRGWLGMAACLPFLALVWIVGSVI